MALLSSVQDSFNDNTENGTLWPNSYNTLAARAEIGGQLVITCIGSTAGSNYSGYVSGNLDLTGSYGLVEVPKVVNVATAADTVMAFYKDASNYVQWIQENGTLFAQKNVATVKNNIITFAYNAVTHRWWKISESGGTVTWWTSPDGYTWTSQGTELVSNLFAITSVQINLIGGTFQSETNPGQCYFDNFNMPRAFKFNNKGLRPHPFSPGLAR